MKKRLVYLILLAFSALNAGTAQDLDKILDANSQTLKILPTLLDGHLEKAMQQLHTK